MQTPFESAQQNLSIVIQNWIAMNLIMEMHNLDEVIEQEQKDLLQSLKEAPEHKKAEIRDIMKKNKQDKELFIQSMTNNVLTDNQMWN
jgi:hypothetical protein